MGNCRDGEIKILLGCRTPKLVLDQIRSFADGARFQIEIYNRRTDMKPGVPFLVVARFSSKSYDNELENLASFCKDYAINAQAVVVGHIKDEDGYLDKDITLDGSEKNYPAKYCPKCRQLIWHNMRAAYASNTCPSCGGGLKLSQWD